MEEKEEKKLRECNEKARAAEEKKTGRIVAKALDGQRYPLPPCEFIWMSGGKRGSGPEGAKDLCLASLELQGWDLSLKAGILA